MLPRGASRPRGFDGIRRGVLKFQGPITPSAPTCTEDGDGRAGVTSARRVQRALRYGTE